MTGFFQIKNKKALPIGRQGFTLIELLIVLSIVSLLSSIVFSIVTNARAKARDAKRQMDMDTIRKAIEMYYSENEKYPNSSTWPNTSGWVSLEGSNEFKSAMGSYLSEIPRDPLYDSSDQSPEYSYWYKGDEQSYSASAKNENESNKGYFYTDNESGGIISQENPPDGFPDLTDSSPTVSTQAVSPPTISTTATLNGFVTSNGYDTEAWFRYSDTNPGTCNDTFGSITTTQSFGTEVSSGLYTSDISNLTLNKTYYFCAIASNEKGISFGSVLSFNTEPAFFGSPFGIMAAFDLSTLTTISATDKVAWAGEKFRDLGAKWSRSNGDNIFWFKQEPVLGGGYDWSAIDAAMDKIYNNGGEGFNTVVIVSPARGTHQNPLPIDILLENEVAFTNFVKAMVERYDGDGANDYNPNIKVKYWQAENEPFPTAWEDNEGTKAGFARFVKLLHDAAVESDPEAKIVLGAASMTEPDRVSIFEEVISKLKLAGTSFDAADTHYWQYEDKYKIPIEDMRRILDSNGYSNVKIFSLEHGSIVGDPAQPDWPIQTEKEQARYLIRSYAYNIANGVSLINWNNLVEWNQFGNNTGNMWNYMGLIADGLNGDLTPVGTSRLSYYTYKKMTEKLEGSDWNSIEKVQETGGVYIYKFTKSGVPVWIAWNDNPSPADITISGIGYSYMKITEAIPNKESGQVVDYNSDFIISDPINVTNGTANITLNNTPVFIEEY